MRKITREAVDAFLNSYDFKNGNTVVSIEENPFLVSMYLHDNKIAEKDNNSIRITNSGWFTDTTKERLNGIPGVSISQYKGKWFLNGVEWDGKWITI